MSYQFLKSEVINGVEYALLLDEQSGSVVRSPIQSPAPQPTYIQPAQPAFITPPVQPQYAPTPVPTFHGVALPDQPGQGAGQPMPEMPRAPSLLPPHLRGVFIDKDEPGAAKESRVA
jgi:hypothetical protein